MIPTHSASLRFKSSKLQRFVSAKVRLDAPSNAAAIAAGRANSAFAPHLVGVLDSDITVKIAKLPRPKVGVTLNEQHDYLTLTVVLPEGRLNLTVSRSGERMTGTLLKEPEAGPFFRRFNALIAAPKATPGGVMRDLAEKLKNATTPAEVFAAI